jgi:hypothetical protein
MPIFQTRQNPESMINFFWKYHFFFEISFFMKNHDMNQHIPPKRSVSNPKWGTAKAIHAVIRTMQLLQPSIPVDKLDIHLHQEFWDQLACSALPKIAAEANYRFTSTHRNGESTSYRTTFLAQYPDRVLGGGTASLKARVLSSISIAGNMTILDFCDFGQVGEDRPEKDPKAWPKDLRKLTRKQWYHGMIFSCTEFRAQYFFMHRADGLNFSLDPPEKRAGVKRVYMQRIEAGVAKVGIRFARVSKTLSEGMGQTRTEMWRTNPGICMPWPYEWTSLHQGLE